MSKQSEQYPDKRRLNLWIDKSVFDAISKLAKANGTTKSGIVVLLLEDQIASLNSSGVNFGLLRQLARSLNLAADEMKQESLEQVS